jgi:hypothetical protein
MNRCVLNVATGSYVCGQERLIKALSPISEVTRHTWANCLPEGSPSHTERPYAFKAYALAHAADAGATTLLWADACILPIRSMEPLWERIEREGYWIARNGWTNYEWTADSAYPDLFPTHSPQDARRVNRTIPHVVATAFGLSLKTPIGRNLFAEYYRLASHTKAFCGPWINANYQEKPGDMRPLMGDRCQPCGSSDVRGHRHDQTALSVIAWRLGCKLTESPHIFSYLGGETEQTILVADGGY